MPKLFTLKLFLSPFKNATVSKITGEPELMKKLHVFVFILNAINQM